MKIMSPGYANPAMPPDRRIGILPLIRRAWRRQHPNHEFWRTDMAWTTPVATDLRFGFEVTMYIATR